jgi:hypothetical protein
MSVNYDTAKNYCVDEAFLWMEHGRPRCALEI